MDSKADLRKQRAQNLRYKGKRGGSRVSEPRQRDKRDIVPLQPNLTDDFEAESSQDRQREGEGEGQGGGEGEVEDKRKSTGADYEALLSEFHADPFFHLSTKTENRSVFTEDWSFSDNLSSFVPPIEQVDVLSLDLEALASNLSSLSLSSRLGIPPVFLSPEENTEFTNFRSGIDDVSSEKDDVSEISDLGSFESLNPSEWEWDSEDKWTEKLDYSAEVLKIGELKISDSNTDTQHMQKVPFPLKPTVEPETSENKYIFEKASTFSSIEQKSKLEMSEVFLEKGENEKNIEDELDALLELKNSDSFQGRDFVDKGKQVLGSTSNFALTDVKKGEKEKSVEDELDELLGVEGSGTFPDQGFVDKGKQVVGSTSNFIFPNVNNGIKFDNKNVVVGKVSKDGANEKKGNSVSTSEDDFDAWLDSVIV